MAEPKGAYASVIASDREAGNATPTEPIQRRRRPPLPIRILFLTVVLSLIYLAATGLHARCHGYYGSWNTSGGGGDLLAPAAAAADMDTLPGFAVERRLQTDPVSSALGLARRGVGLLRHRFAKPAAFANTRRQQGGGGPGGGGQQPRKVLECFQAAQPVLQQNPNTIDAGLAEPTASPCTVQLMDHVFGWSYGKPFVGNYTPPNCDFNRVVVNFSAVSAGRQYDRLALMYLNDTEVWRTSTAEPVASPGIHWQYLKDMTPYLSLWRQPQQLIFDLGNLVDDTYTGSFNTTLTATFFMSAVQTNAAPPADAIIPISRRAASSGKDPANPVSHFSVPEHDASATVASFPRNANRAVLSVSANGQAGEEFWWGNVLEADRFTFNETAGEAYGLGPFREVQAYIDGRLAGVQWPFPVIFTGGIVPSFHRPVVGLQAFDLREHEIDVTPWLPLLCDGNPHNVSFRIAGLNGDGATKATLTNGVNPSWYISGKIFVWLDAPGSITTGTPPQISGVDPTVVVTRALSTGRRGLNQTLDYTVSVTRDLAISATVNTQNNTATNVYSWTQKLSYVNVNNFTNYGLEQLTNFSVSGSDTASRNGSSSSYSSSPSSGYSSSAMTPIYGVDYNYPLRVRAAYNFGPNGAMSIRARLYQGLALQVAGAATFPDGLESFSPRVDASPGGGEAGGNQQQKRYVASALSTYRDGAATYSRPSTTGRSTGSGNIHQEFAFGGSFARYDADKFQGRPDVVLYYRNVTAADDAVTSDREERGYEGTTGKGGRIGDDEAPPTTTVAQGLGGDDGFSLDGGDDGQLVFGTGGDSEGQGGEDVFVAPPRMGRFKDLEGRQMELLREQQQQVKL